METHYDPFNQNLTFQVGLESVNVTVADLNDLVQEGIQSAIVYGSQIGASAVTLLMLLLLTQAEKRRTAMFALNIAALALDVARVVGSVLFFTGGFFNLYRVVTGDYTTVPLSDYVTSIMSQVFLTLEEICINTSLVVQIMAVCSMLRRLHKALVIALSIIVAIVPIGFRFATLVLNSIFIMKALDFSGCRKSTPSPSASSPPSSWPSSGTLFTVAGLWVSRALDRSRQSSSWAVKQ